jgi:hypothetical protein
MQIPFDILSPSCRAAWVEVPARRDDRAAGTARVKLQELPRLLWDDLYAGWLSADRAIADLALAEAEERKKAAELEPESRTEKNREISERYRPRMIAATDERRAAEIAILQRCVVDHDPKTFKAKVPVAVSDAQAEALRAVLLDRGFTPGEADCAIVAGEVEASFSAASWEHGGKTYPGAAESTARLYLKCQPGEAFSDGLIEACKRFQLCEPVSPEALWKVAPLAQAGGARPEEK